MMSQVPTTPELPVNQGFINDAKSFSGAFTLDLTDDQIQTAWRIIQDVRKRYQQKFRNKFNDPINWREEDLEKYVDEFEDEVKTRLAESVGLLATVNVLPIFNGEPIAIEILGVLPGGDLEKYGMDHEKKEWEVKKATAQGEDFLGQKG